VKKADFVAFLKAALRAVEEDDTMEGRIQYEFGDIPGEFNVNAFVRVGNSQGQGGAILSNDKLREI